MEWFNMVRSRCCPVFLVLFLQSSFRVGMVRSMGLLLEHVSGSIPWDAADLGTAIGLFYAVGLLSTPIVASLMTRVTCPRLLLVLCAAIGSSTIILASFATSKLHIFIVFAVSGSGFCFLRFICLNALDRLAGENFSILFGLSTCGFSVGMCLFPFLAEELVVAYDWRGALLILGGIMLNAVPCTMCIRITNQDFAPRCRKAVEVNSMDSGLEAGVGGDDVVQDTCTDPLLTPSKEHKKTASVATPPDNDFDHKTCLHYITIFRRKISSWIQSKGFYADPFSLFILLSIAVLFFVYNGWHAFLVPHARQRDISSQNTILITSIAAVGNISVRLIVAPLTHRLVDPINIFLLLTLVNIFSLACDAFLPNFYIMLATSMCSSAAIAGRSMIGIPIMRNRISSEYIAMALALCYFLEGCGFFLGAFLSGLIADVFSSYDATFKLLAAVDILTFIFMLIPKLVKKPSLHD